MMCFRCSHRWPGAYNDMSSSSLLSPERKTCKTALSESEETKFHSLGRKELSICIIAFAYQEWLVKTTRTCMFFISNISNSWIPWKVCKDKRFRLRSMFGTFCEDIDFSSIFPFMDLIIMEYWETLDMVKMQLLSPLSKCLQKKHKHKLDFDQNAFVTSLNFDHNFTQLTIVWPMHPRPFPTE